MDALRSTPNGMEPGRPAGWDARWLAAPPRLTRREWLVLELAAEGRSTRDIAEQLSVTDQAVTYHLGNLMSKFGAPNRAGLVARAFVFGYLDADAWPPSRVGGRRISA